VNEAEVVRREENEQYGNEIMRKRCGTLDQERQQELSGLLQVIGNKGGEKDGNLGFGKMAEEREQVLSSLHEIIPTYKRREEDGREHINCLHEKSQEELSNISKIVLSDIPTQQVIGDGSQKSDLDRTSMGEVKVRSGHTPYTSFYDQIDILFLRGCEK
jgi:hypothetical protein